MTLNFSPILLDNARAYAKRHDMKLNAVFKKAFELLQDEELKEKHRLEVLERLQGEEAPY